MGERHYLSAVSGQGLLPVSGDGCILAQDSRLEIVGQHESEQCRSGIEDGAKTTQGQEPPDTSFGQGKPICIL